MAEEQREPVPRNDSGELDTALADSDAAIRAAGDPGAVVGRPVDGDRLTLRWLLAHMTSEVARHAGHADILREQIDGATGR